MNMPLGDGNIESFFRSMFTSAPVGVSIASFDGQFMQVNPTLCSMLGYSEEELNQLGLLSVTHPDDLAAEMQLLDEMRESRRTSYRVEKRCIRADGSILHTRLTVALARGVHGQPIGGIGFLEDLEHEHRAMQLVRESDARFRSLVQHSSDAVLVIDDERTVTYASPSCDRVLGWPAHELLGWSAHELFGLEGDRSLASLEPGVMPSNTWQFQCLVTGRDSEQRWVEVSVSDKRSDPSVGAAVLNCRDVSERVLAYETLLESQERYRTVVEAVHEVVFQADAEGCWTYLNPAFEVHTGYAIAEALGRNFLDIIHPDDRASNLQVLQAMRRGLITEGHLEGRYQSKAGSVGLFLGHLRAIRDSSGGLVGFAGVIRDVTQTKELETQLSNLSFRDPLTGLANRSVLLDRLEQMLARAKRESTNLAVIHLGIDGFRDFNERFGTMAGDTVLVGIAGRLGGVIRGSETIARVGGDEFVIVSEPIASMDHLRSVVARVSAVLGEPFMVEGSERRVSVSFGALLESPARTRDSAEVLRTAGLVLARAKARGQDETEYLETGAHPSGHSAAPEALSMEIAGALAKGELALNYQPTVDLESRTVVGFEALLRWQHPRRGVLVPADVLPIAEAAGVDEVLARWIVSRAVEDLRMWGEFSEIPLTMTINMSARQLAMSSVVDEVLESVTKGVVQPGQLIIDLTERAAVAEANTSREGLRRLREVGVGVALDDFGSGHSSLLFLRHFPISMVKVDPSFIAKVALDEADQAVVSAVVALAKGMGLVAVAEGVENEEQAAALVRLGCHQAQGHLFGHPISNYEVEHLLRADRP